MARKKNYRGKHQAARQEPPVNEVLVGVLAAVLLAAVLAALFLLITKPWESGGTIYQGVFAAGVDLGGMTQKEAEDALRRTAADTYSRQAMVVRVGEKSIELNPESTHIQLDAAAVAREAYEYGRRGTQQEQEQAQEQARTDGYTVDVTNRLNLDMDAISRAVSMLGAEFQTGTEWHLEGEQPSLAMDQPNAESQTLVITLGTEFSLDADALTRQILEAYNENRFLVEIPQEQMGMASVDLDAIYESCYVAPVDAEIDEKTYTVLSPGSYGYGFDLENARAQLSAAQPGDVLRIPLERIEPAVTAATVTNQFRDILASYSSPYDPSDTDRTQNLRLACQAINGLVMQPGDVFSYNDTLGQRTEEKGYRPGDAYVSGETVKTIGGGICQVSSTLYYCAMVADLEIVERDCHMFAPTYVPLGMDATINWETIDFKFRNSTSYPLRIEASLEPDQVTVQLLGIDDKDYYVKLEYEILETIDYATVYQEMEFGNEGHYVDGDVIVTPYTGYEVQTYRCKYDRDTDALISREEEAYSRYDPRDEVICKIIMSIPDDLLTGGGVGAGGSG